MCNLSNVIQFPTTMTKRNQGAKNPLQYDLELCEARHRLTMVFLDRMIESHHTHEAVQEIIALHHKGSQVARIDDLRSLEDIIHKLETFNLNLEIPKFNTN